MTHCFFSAFNGNLDFVIDFGFVVYLDLDFGFAYGCDLLSWAFRRRYRVFRIEPIALGLLTSGLWPRACGLDFDLHFDFDYDLIIT